MSEMRVWISQCVYASDANWRAAVLTSEGPAKYGSDHMTSSAASASAARTGAGCRTGDLAHVPSCVYSLVCVRWLSVASMSLHNVLHLTPPSRPTQPTFENSPDFVSLREAAVVAVQWLPRAPTVAEQVLIEAVLDPKGRRAAELG